MIVTRVHGAAGEWRAASHLEPIGPFIRVGAHRAESRHELGDAVALLDPQLAGAGHGDAAAKGPERREHGELVDHLGHLDRFDHEVAHHAVTHPQPAHRLAIPVVFDRGLDLRPETSQHVE